MFERGVMDRGLISVIVSSGPDRGRSENVGRFNLLEGSGVSGGSLLGDNLLFDCRGAM